MAATSSSALEPSLIADNVHVVYRVFGHRKAGYRASRSDKPFSAIRSAKKHRNAITEVHAVRGISLVAHHGESIGIVGNNGAGKSTLLRALAGLIPATEGSVYANSRPSLLGVNAALIPSMTGERNIFLGGLALGLSESQIREKFDEIVEFAGIGDFVYLPMDAYSSGMQARLRFAISATIVPEILMIDEALATGDATYRRKSAKKFAEIRDSAGTVFLVSHNASAIEEHCSRVIWIRDGLVEADGPTKDVLPEFIKFQEA